MADELNRAVGALIRRHRLEAGLSQASMAEALSLSRSSVANIESGRQPLSIGGLYDVAGALGLPVAELLPADPARPHARGRRARGVGSLLRMLDQPGDRAA